MVVKFVNYGRTFMIGNAVGFIWLRWDILNFMYENARFRRVSYEPNNPTSFLIRIRPENAENNEHPEADSSGLQMDVNSHFQADATGDNEVFDSFIVSEWKGFNVPSAMNTK